MDPVAVRTRAFEIDIRSARTIKVNIRVLLSRNCIFFFFFNQVRLFFLFTVGGLTSHRSSLRVCQAKRVAPPIVPDSAASTAASASSASTASVTSGGTPAHRHSSSSFDSTGGSLSSAESTASGLSGGYCSGSGGSVTAWSQSGVGDQRSSIGLDDGVASTFGHHLHLPPPPGSPAAISSSAASSSSQPTTPVKHLHHLMYRGMQIRGPFNESLSFFSLSFECCVAGLHPRVPTMNRSVKTWGMSRWLFISLSLVTLLQKENGMMKRKE